MAPKIKKKNNGEQPDTFNKFARSVHATQKENTKTTDKLLRATKRTNGSDALEFKEIVQKLKQRLENATVKLDTEPAEHKRALYRDPEFYRPTDIFRTQPEPRRPYSLDTANDYARIIHSAVFRQLQGKTQLFPVGESELLRTRLTHSLEVAEVASRIASKINQQPSPNRLLKIDMSIVAAASLAHDLGHPPFGHAGEKVLNAKMKGAGGFEGNAQCQRRSNTRPQ